MSDISKIIFLGTPQISADLLSFIIDNKLAKVMGVITNPDRKSGRGSKIHFSPVKETALKYDLPLYQPDNPNTPAGIDWVKNISPEIIFIISYGKILKTDFFNSPQYGSFNLHFSLLPAHRGASPIQSAILHGEEYTGITIQKINEKMDDGDISLQNKFSIINLYQDEVFSKAKTASKELITSFFKTTPSSFINLRKQSGTISFCKKFLKEDGIINLNDTAELIYNKIRAFHPWPGFFFHFNNTHFIITRGDLIKEKSDFEPGTLEKSGKKKLILWCSNGGINILRIKPQNKKEMDVVSFLNGTKISFPIRISESS